MYTDGIQDMSVGTLAYMFHPKETRQKWLEDEIKKVRRRYLPAFEKVCDILQFFLCTIYFFISKNIQTFSANILFSTRNLIFSPTFQHFCLWFVPLQ